MATGNGQALIGERPKVVDAKPPARFSKTGELPPPRQKRKLFGEAHLRRVLNLSEDATTEQVCEDACSKIAALEDKLGESEKAIHEASRSDDPPTIGPIKLKKGPLEGI